MTCGWGSRPARLAGPGPEHGDAAKVVQYVAAVEAFAASNTVALALADELAAGRIEATLAKSDLELGVETFAEALARQANPFPDASPVQVRYRLAADDTDEKSWPWQLGTGGGHGRPGQWQIMVTDDRLVEGWTSAGLRSTRAAAARPEAIPL